MEIANLEDLFTVNEYKEITYSYKNIEQKYLAAICSSTDYDLTGQILWPASELLSRYLITESSLFLNKNIVELGSGCGLCGLLASQFGKNVIMTDHNEIVLDLLSRNSSQYNHGEDHQIYVSHLDWSNIDLMSLTQWGEKSQSIPESLLTNIDWVIGSEIVYYPQSIQPLYNTLQDILKYNPSVQILITHKVRAQNIENMFQQIGKSKGFQINEVNFSNISEGLEQNLVFYSLKKIP